ncbi:methylmalonate-semialdehyde dehydrogenase [acylating], mitochondrial isoform X8 [Citrus clementina]|uniref:methylmalonate-semialdehyde dehydrogenase [acylating], mitochondrial isoform X8 n=1 Tax=Citrus clementina TaxID=85681 RepID=UPI000CED707B|nr:methylmalonate-semialdehyde dehydrogenase [acylating], mitochondrial isoform X8 [Citrus x clementina]
MHPCPSASHLLHSLMMDFQSSSEFNDAPQMLPPPPGTFVDREELIQHVGDFAVSQGYVVTIKQSKRDRVVVLGCDRGGVYRNRRKPVDESSAESLRRRKTGSRLTNCPFEAVGKKDDGLWKLSIKNGAHNHEPLKDLSEHPSARRFTEREVLLIKEMTEAGLKPRQILKRLRQSNPELLSTPKHVYNVKAKLRQGNVTVRNFKSLRPQKTAVRNNYQSVMEPSWRQRNPPVSFRCNPRQLRSRKPYPKLLGRVPNLIGGRFVDSKSLTSIDVVNPATQLIVSQVPLSTNEEVRAAVFAAKRAFSSWRNTPATNRQRIMFKFQELIRRDMMFPIAVTCGNTFILKPSEKVPGAAVILAELAVEAGLPNGVLNIVHGTDDIINAICDDDDVKAIALVGPNSDVADIYSRASAKGKRIQCNIGAKNHAVVMPDASIDATLSALVAAGFGGAGQKCMALTTVVYVGGITPWEDKLVEHAKAIKVNAGTESNADLGPVISKQEKERICRLIQVDTESGAKLLLDGRNILVPGYENGNFIGPTILSDVTVNMECYKEDVFGPVLLCMQVLPLISFSVGSLISKLVFVVKLHIFVSQAESIDEAIEIVNRNRHGSGASIFTTSAVAARKFQIEIAVGQVGINVPISVQPPFTLFTSSKPCFAGDLNCDGKGGIHFYTQIKTVTQQWKDLPGNVETPTSNSNGESLQLLNS